MSLCVSNVNKVSIVAPHVFPLVIFHHLIHLTLSIVMFGDPPTQLSFCQRLHLSQLGVSPQNIAPKYLKKVCHFIIEIMTQHSITHKKSFAWKTPLKCPRSLEHFCAYHAISITSLVHAPTKKLKLHNGNIATYLISLTYFSLRCMSLACPTNHHLYSRNLHLSH